MVCWVLPPTTSPCFQVNEVTQAWAKSLCLHNRHTSPQQAGKFQQYPTFSGGSTQSPPTQYLMGERKRLSPRPLSRLLGHAPPFQVSLGLQWTWKPPALLIQGVQWAGDCVAMGKVKYFFIYPPPSEQCVTDAYQPENPAQPFSEAFWVPGRSRAFRYSQTIISSLIILFYSLAWKQRLIESKVLRQSSAGNLLAVV